MTNKLYVGNLPYDTSAEDLQEAFGAYGEVQSSVIITDRDTGRSKGFGFVEMSSSEEASAAQAAMNQTQLGGRTLKVDLARPRERRDDDRRGGGNRGPRY